MGGARRPRGARTVMPMATTGPRPPEANAPQVVPSGVAGPECFAVRAAAAVRLIAIVEERPPPVPAPALPALRKVPRQQDALPLQTRRLVGRATHGEGRPLRSLPASAPRRGQVPPAVGPAVPAPVPATRRVRMSISAAITPEPGVVPAVPGQGGPPRGGPHPRQGTRPL